MFIVFTLLLFLFNADNYWKVIVVFITVHFVGLYLNDLVNDLKEKKNKKENMK